MSIFNVNKKKLLILGGNTSHSKIVEVAKKMGVYTIVTDYLKPEESPAKQIADEYWMLSYGDIEAVTTKCREIQIDGVLACYHESALIPYYHICKELNLPCYGDISQFEKLTNKKLFKQMCSNYGINTIPEYTLESVEKGNVEFPVIVKPIDRCGSKGQAICYNIDELKTAILEAKKESILGEVLIEKYLENKNSFQVTYFFIDGKPYVIRTVDGYKGSIQENLDRVALCSVSPSIYTENYLLGTNNLFTEMLIKNGVLNGPVMAQGFYDEGVFRFYDPGRRFPGTEFEIIYNEMFGINLLEMIVCFALTGKMPEVELKNENVFLDGKKVIVLFPTLREGTIADIRGYDILSQDDTIRRVSQMYYPGATINNMNTALQRIFEIDFICNSIEESKKIIEHIQQTIEVKDINGEDMIYKPFDVNRLTKALED